jgi:hypothetical protein
MIKAVCMIGVLAAMAACAFGGGSVTWTASTGTNATASAYADPFTGEIDEVAVFASVATGTVSIAVIDPYSGDALVLATNAACGEYVVWTPRLTEAAMTGDAARVVTNSASADRINAQGERVLASFAASSTGVTYRVRIKLK